MAAEIVRVSLTEEMVQGVIGHRAELLARLRHIPELADVHIVRGEAVIRQFGPGLTEERPVTEREKRVLQAGKPVEEVHENENVIFHYTIPYIASTSGVVNCMQCHKVQEGTVLGAVSMSMDLTKQRRDAMQSVAMVVLLLFVFGIGLVYFLRRLLNPIIETASEMQLVVSQAEEGDFSSRLEKHSDDEIGDIAVQINQLMSTLEENIGNIFREVKVFTGSVYQAKEDNLLKRTTLVVKNLAEATHFKRTIENDRNLDEVYGRIQRVLRDQFGLTRFSMYEVNNSKNRLQLVFAEGLPEAAELWCDPEVLIRSDACRSKRTAQVISSMDEPEICPAFFGNRIQDKCELLHICLPLMLGGSIGGVLQLIFTHEETENIREKIAAIQTFLDEAAPVIEAKRLMRFLREASMRDAMTGLYNRRFLEEYVETLTASVVRKEGSVGVLMCDVDFFKQVNDTLGHDIGDGVLKTVAEILKESVRASDLIIRYGGEEFLALLVDAGEEKAMEVAERIRSAMEEHTFQTTSGPLKKTLSVGVALYPADGEAFWECVKFADVALYKAKDRGRNKVLRFDKSMWDQQGEY